ncbi:oligosaccharide flippase family protein [bacterium]|nr:oligosaccharide flippase family protein [bacterium]
MDVRKHVKILAGESAIYGIPGVIGSFIGIFLVPVYTRIFDPSEYGIISLLTVFANLVSMVAVLALDNSAARWFYDTTDIEDRRKTISSWFWCQLVISSSLAILTAWLAPWISNWLIGSNDGVILIRLIALGIPFVTGGKVLGSWLRYKRRAKSAVTFSISQTIGGIGLIILFVVVWEKGLIGLFTAKLLTPLITSIVAVFILGKWISPFAASWSRLREMLRYSTPLIPAAIGLWVMMSMDRFMLKHFTDVSEVGLYSIAATISTGIALVTAAFSRAWGPFAFSIMKQEYARAVYSKVLTLYSFLGCALCGILTLFAPLILRILTTEVYYPAASTVSFLVFGTLLNGSCFIAVLGCGIAKKSLPRAISVAIGATANLSLNLLLIPVMGRNGAALATMLSWGLSVSYSFFASQKYYFIPYKWKQALAPVALLWSLIILDSTIINGNDLFANLIRGCLMLTFVPLAFFLRIIRMNDILKRFN